MNDLIKTSELTGLLGVSSRTLCYYEQIGLIKSIRPQFETYRYYNEEAIKRVRQICVLRKMQISNVFTKVVIYMQEYRKTGELWNELEALGGGFNVSLEVLKEKEKAKAIADKIREFPVCLDRVVAVIE